MNGHDFEINNHYFLTDSCIVHYIILVVRTVFFLFKTHLIQFDNVICKYFYVKSVSSTYSKTKGRDVEIFPQTPYGEFIFTILDRYFLKGPWFFENRKSALLFMKKVLFLFGKNKNMYLSVVATFHLSCRKAVVFTFVCRGICLRSERFFFLKKSVQY